MPCQFLFVDVSHSFAGEPCWEPPGYSENSTCAPGVLKQDNLVQRSFPTEQVTAEIVDENSTHSSCECVE